MIFSKKTDKKVKEVKQAEVILEPRLDVDMSLPEKAESSAEQNDKSLAQRVGDKMSAPFTGLNYRLRQKLRNTAIERARTRILIAGQTPEALPAETLEIVVREEEDKLKNQIKEKGLLFVVASLGLGWWL